MYVVSIDMWEYMYVIVIEDIYIFVCIEIYRIGIFYIDHNRNKIVPAAHNMIIYI